VFLLIAFIYLNSVLANEKGLKVNSNISKRDLLDDFIGNSRNLDDRNNDYNNESYVNPESVSNFKFLN
jgi:hypothetical protein